jgi:hypothetical protein
MDVLGVGLIEEGPVKENGEFEREVKVGYWEINGSTRTVIWL